MDKLKIEWMFERGHDLDENLDLLQLLDTSNIHCILIRTTSFYPDPWGVAYKYSALTKNIKFMLAINPAQLSPTYCAMKVATFQKIFGDRLILNIVSGAHKEELASYGDHTPISLRYKRSLEYAEIVKKLVTNGRIDSYNGEFYQLENVDTMSGCDFEIVFAGSSDNTIHNANSVGNAHYYAMETLEQYKQNRNKIKVDSGIKATIIVEKDSRSAWDTTEQILTYATDEIINSLKEEALLHESQNVVHQQKLHNYSKENLTIEKNIWAGFGLLRHGGITAMVGSYVEVADLIENFYNAGLNRLLLGGTPEIYYANNFINGVMPILKNKGII
ncbi:MAG: hypothetical protein RLZZ196_55 [Bacteroidota bacterium]